eukprot:Opistho-2@51535
MACLQCSCCEHDYYDVSGARNTVVSYVSGLLFAIGWWLCIDANAVDKHYSRPEYNACGVVSTLALFMINSVTSGHLAGDMYTGGLCAHRMVARTWLFLGFLAAFGGLIGSAWILFGDYVAKEAHHTWPGAAFFLQNLLIFLSAMFMKFGRAEDY